MTRENLCLSLEFEPTQLLLEPRGNPRQFGKIGLNGVPLLLESRAEDTHLAGVVQQVIE